MWRRVWQSVRERERWFVCEEKRIVWGFFSIKSTNLVLWNADYTARSTQNKNKKNYRYKWCLSRWDSPLKLASNKTRQQLQARKSQRRNLIRKNLQHVCLFDGAVRKYADHEKLHSLLPRLIPKISLFFFSTEVHPFLSEQLNDKPFFFSSQKIYIKSTSLSYICSLNIHTTNKLHICHLQIYNSTQTDLQRDWYKHQNNILVGCFSLR